MKKFTLLLLSALCFGFVACETSTTEQGARPTVALEQIAVTSTSVTFKVTTTDATEASYMVLGDEEDIPALETILANGTAVALKGGAAEVTATGLTAETEYKVVAAAKNGENMAGSNTLYVTTAEAGQLAIDVELASVAHDSINFRYTITGAERAAYLVVYATKEVTDASYVFLNGTELDLSSKEAVEVKDLENVKEYRLVVAAEDAEHNTLIKDVTFTTKDDPTNVIEHNYTRVRGSKYSSNYYIMFSYEDANEADNFAYNDKTLCLDFYGDPDKDYLPAGTYEVKESTEWPCLNSMRYSTYGYDNGVLLKSGSAVVSIDPETKAYTFEIDLYLKDGRHLVANYTGDVENMPVVDKVTVSAKYTSANATTADSGRNWSLTLADATGNTAVINLANAFKAPYIVANSYTINTSAEEYSVKRQAAEAGQFDSETSYFVVAGDQTQYKFATGTLTMDINWATSTYMLSFYGKLENGYIIESEYNGVIEGCSLKQSDEIIDFELNTASARSYNDNTNWYLTFTQTIDGVENYRLILDAYCPSRDYLPAGIYEIGNSNDGCSLGADLTTLHVWGESTYHAVEARATVTTNMATKEYTFVISLKVEDGRTFLMSYVGKVIDMEIVDAEDVPEDINWTTVTARHWYQDNWQLVIKDESEAYSLEFDLYCSDTSLSYIPTGVYTLTGSTFYIKNNYSKFNGSSNAYKEITLDITYNEATETYDISFDIILSDDRTLTGSYSGAVAGSPIA